MRGIPALAAEKNRLDEWSFGVARAYALIQVNSKNKAAAAAAMRYAYSGLLFRFWGSLGKVLITGLAGGNRAACLDSLLGNYDSEDHKYFRCPVRKCSMSYPRE